MILKDTLGYGCLAKVDPFLNVLHTRRLGDKVQEGVGTVIKIASDVAKRLHFRATVQVRYYFQRAIHLVPFFVPLSSHPTPHRGPQVLVWCLCGTTGRGDHQPRAQDARREHHQGHCQ